ncbi:hypothetical protein BH09VER1_BH09VER1_30900 [soil metagenome]
MVGAVADERLAGTPAGKEVTTLLNGMTLQRAATLPDEIKGWDRGGGPDSPGGFHLPEYPEIEKQLAAFWKANQVSGPAPADENLATTPSHHWFHYTDVPVGDGELYESGTAGRSKWDIVHMTDFCIKVLQGKESDVNDRAITKPVAIILLSHYLGDIHQPLHVGAEFFDKSGHPVNPDKVPESYGDQGGNTFFLMLKGAQTSGGKRTTLHGFWDTPAALAALDQIKKVMLQKDPAHTGDFTTDEIAKYLAANPAPGWEIPASVPIDDVGKYLANDILPQAALVHSRLKFEGVQVKSERGSELASGFAREESMPDGLSYTDWAGALVATELDKGGCRLAYILEKALASAPAAPPEAAPSVTPASNNLAPAAVSDSAAPSATPTPEASVAPAGSPEPFSIPPADGSTPTPRPMDGMPVATPAP